MKGSHLFWLSRSKGITLLTFGLGIIILQGVSRRKSLAGVSIMVRNFKFQYDPFSNFKKMFHKSPFPIDGACSKWCILFLDSFQQNLAHEKIIT
jgi:hypothetical protein